MPLGYVNRAYHELRQLLRDVRSSRALPPRLSFKSGLQLEHQCQSHAISLLSRVLPEVFSCCRMTDEVKDAFAALFDETFMQQMAGCCSM